MTKVAHHLCSQHDTLFNMMKRLILVLFLAASVLVLGIFRPILSATTPTAATREQFIADRIPAAPLEPLAAVTCDSGMAATYPCRDVDLLSFTPLSDMGGGKGNDIWGWTDPLTDKEYAIMGTTLGTTFIDISDPVNPIYLGLLPKHSSNNNVLDQWRDVKVYNNYAFVVSENRGQGMQIFDLTELRSVASPPATFANSAHYDGIGGSHNIFINENSGYAYVVGAVLGFGTEDHCLGGLHIVNVNDPLNPTFTGCYSGDSYTHDVQCVIYAGADAAYTGREICFASNTDTLTIIDATDKISPTQISRTGYLGRGYTHQGWLTDDQNYFLLNDETDEDNSGRNAVTYMWDVRDLDAPIMFADYESAVPIRDHNLYIKGNFTYQANYQGGLRILALTHLAAGTLTEEAYFDIYTPTNSIGYNGAWSVYPFFPSGNIIVSGIEQGLYVLRHNVSPTLSLLNAPADALICDGSSQTVPIQINQFADANTLTLSTQTLPNHITSAFVPSTVNGGGAIAATLHLTASDNTIGEYPIGLRATDGTFVGESALTLSTQVQPVAIPTAPLTDWKAFGMPAFTWTATASTLYTVEIATDAAFSNVVISGTVTGDTYTPSMALIPKTTYHWRVSGSNQCGSISSASTTFLYDPIISFLYLPTVIKP